MNMKIVSWNCRGKFREKYSFLQKLDADIYVIQECENPKIHQKIADDFCSNYYWCGESDSKGLGIFLKSSIKAEKNDWQTYCLRNFISLRINDDFDLLGVWACSPYIEEYYIYQSINIDRYNKNIVVIGDFNSNAIWDKKRNKRNHCEVVKQLERIGISSIYHHITGEKQGQETQKTFYLYKHRDKAYHIDHCFANKERILDYSILDTETWLKYSDHIPIELILKY